MLLALQGYIKFGSAEEIFKYRFMRDSDKKSTIEPINTFIREVLSEHDGHMVVILFLLFTD
ncbi:hypothetical protein HA41_16755 [Pantoea conspicua]|uniref:Uncharacterized protein n=1 Tax=Pantoea conspicua TaxID=472705 RepID=A0A1X1BSF9_9GAMM|nr:hypothetical protein HA41_16755 [Pantoea conspicua]